MFDLRARAGRQQSAADESAERPVVVVLVGVVDLDVELVASDLPERHWLVRSGVGGQTAHDGRCRFDHGHVWAATDGHDHDHVYVFLVHFAYVMARLLFRDSQGREGTVELSPTETVYVGRGLECAIRTDDGMVSRKHAQFRMENGRFVVEDLGSANGTHLNNTRIQKQAIGHADVIQCGSLVIRFVDEGGVNVVPQQIQPGANPPPKRAARWCSIAAIGRRRPTAVPSALPSAPSPSRPNSPSGFPPPAANNFAGPPSQFGPTPYGAPPAMPKRVALRRVAALPYGGPPQMPGGGTFGGSRGGFGGSAGRRCAIAVRCTAADAVGRDRRRPANSSPPPNMPYGGPPAMPSQPGGGPMPYGGPPEHAAVRRTRASSGAAGR